MVKALVKGHTLCIRVRSEQQTEGVAGPGLPDCLARMPKLDTRNAIQPGSGREYPVQHVAAEGIPFELRKILLGGTIRCIQESPDRDDSR